MHHPLHRFLGYLYHAGGRTPLRDPFTTPNVPGFNPKPNPEPMYLVVHYDIQVRSRKNRRSDLPNFYRTVPAAGVLPIPRARHVARPGIVGQPVRLDSLDELGLGGLISAAEADD